jgi:prepilin-type N-terminal cleavage/methylation domain-containing protein
VNAKGRKFHLGCPTCRTRRAQPGFSIIELLVVMVIIAILASLALPAVKAVTRDNSAAQAKNQIRAMISQARSIAMAEHRQAGVVFFRETVRFAMPVHADQVAMQIFVEDFDQVTATPKNPKNTLFKQYSMARNYLPKGIAVAALNDHITDKKIKGVITEDSSGGHNLAILFDPSGRMITRHGVARRNRPSSGTPGTYPWAMGDWNFPSQGTVNSDNSSEGISSPGIFLYDRDEYLAQNIPDGADGDEKRDAWIKAHASVILVNPNTGSFSE